LLAVRGVVKGRTVCLVLSESQDQTVPAAERRSRVDLLLFGEGRSPSTVTLPGGGTARDGFFADLDGDGSQEVVLLDRTIRIYGLAKD
jgi:hypothetical protein